MVPRHHGGTFPYIAKCRASPLVSSKAFFWFCFICSPIAVLLCWCSSSCPCFLAWGQVVIQAPETFIIENVPLTGDCISRARTQQRFWMLKFPPEVPRLLWTARIETLLKNFSCILLHCSSNCVPWNFRECVFWTNISWLERVNEGSAEVLLVQAAIRGHRKFGQERNEIYL